MHKESMRQEAIRLRYAGYSYPYISKKVGLSKSTLSGWLTEIPYKPNAETIATLGKARAASTEKKALLKQEQILNIRKEAVREIGKFTDRDLFMLGLGLYLGEGAKTHDIVRVVNADPTVIKCMVAWFLALGVKESQFSVRLHLYPDSDPEQSLLFWSKTISIPRSQFQKPYIDQRTDKKVKKHNKLPYGTLHLGVRSDGRKEYGVLFSRRILALVEGVLKNI